MAKSLPPHWEFIPGSEITVLSAQSPKPVKLRRIRATRSFVVGDNYQVTTGTVGGYIQNRKNISGNGWVAETAVVRGRAVVGDSAVLLGRATAQDQAKVKGRAMVSQEAVIRDNAVIRDHACVSGQANIGGDAVVMEQGHVYHNASVTDQATVKGSSRVCDYATVRGNAVTSDQSRIQDSAVVLGTSVVSEMAKVGGMTCLAGRSTVQGDAIVFLPTTRMVPDLEIRSEQELLVLGPALSSGRFTVAIRNIQGSLKIRTGCFCGDLDDFTEAIKDTHPKGSPEYRQYMKFAELIKLHFTLVKREKKSG